MKKLTYLLIVLPLLLVTTGAVAAPVVYQDEATFVAATGAAPLTFPADADTALPYKPFASYLVDYSCIQGSIGIDVAGVVTVKEAIYPDWICYIGPDWNAPLSNTNPKPQSPTIVANGEDDYLLVNFANPVYAVGFELLTNQNASETITLTFSDSSTASFTDSELETGPNTFEFVGFKSDKPIVSVAIDTTGGAVQNEGIAGIWLTIWADIDIKPGSYPNAINLSSNGVIPVAILGSDTFDVTRVDPATVFLEGAALRLKGKSGNYGSFEDVNCDGYVDLVVHIVDFSVDSGATTAALTGNLLDGTPFAGTDSIYIVPPE